MSLCEELKKEVMMYARKMQTLGLTPGTQGNISVRDSDSGYMIITPHDYPYDRMTEDDLVILDTDLNVKVGSRAPSEESAVHAAVYKERPEVMGIVHTEPIYANAFGALGKEIAPVFVNMALYVGGAVPVMPFSDSGSAEFGMEMMKVMGKRNAVIWGAHGLLTVGTSLEKAFHCTVLVEMGAKIYHISLCHGDPIAIPQSKIDELVPMKFGSMSEDIV